MNKRRDLINALIEEVIEDIALTRAIQEGKNTDFVSRDKVMKIIEDQA